MLAFKRNKIYLMLVTAGSTMPTARRAAWLRRD